MLSAADIKWDSFSGRLREARTTRGLTRQALSVRAGYSSIDTVKRYENAPPAAPQDDVVYRLADALGVNPLWLMFGRGDPGYRSDWTK